MVHKAFALLAAFVLTFTFASAYHYDGGYDRHRTVNTYSNEYIDHNHYVNRYHNYNTYYRDYHNYDRNYRSYHRNVRVYHHYQPIILHETRHHPHRYALSNHYYW